MQKMTVVIGIILGALLCLSYQVGNAKSADFSDEALPDLYIKAVNPGYTVDGVGNVGEFVEIAKKSPDSVLSLAGTAVSYTNSSGNSSILFEFPENSRMTGETLLLRLASSPSAELAAVNYTKTLAFKASITLLRNDEVLDQVCWTGKDGCLPEFKSSSPTILVRNSVTNEFEHVKEYEPIYDEKNYYEEKIVDDDPAIKSQCKGLEFSEILSYYETSQSEQFIEFHNSSSEQILLDDCKIRYKNKAYGLSGIVRADEYVSYTPKLFNLTKNPTTSNLLEIMDADGVVVDTLSYPNGQRKGTSYALIGYGASGEELWHLTYAPTPGSPNNYQEFKTCEVGKVLNRETGNCVKATEVAEKTCSAGYYLNILTGRCRKIEEKTEKTCKEGYYLNPETNRCRKITDNKGADYSLKPEEYEEKSSFVAVYAVIGLLGLGLIYLIYEFRKEIVKLFRKVFPKSH